MRAALARGILPTVPANDTEVIAALCDRFVLLQEASGLSKKEFAERVGLTSQQFTNISVRRNPPSHTVLSRVIEEFGVPANYFYSGIRVGIQDPDLADRLRDAALKTAAAVGADLEEAVPASLATPATRAQVLAKKIHRK